ncbi:A kinase (PRKA) anchor protein 7 [Perkinsus chesapeaki]|uniref:A kinase (PRKA) anchor protein 7 n=1 Tax=Perkinsus chesapeaki TaxID=330153 RepID=A0A7J6MK92_PERCH|nr:A kinase (PRKA) anchor protein 7 [Perkinsus chesapeaki]
MGNFCDRPTVASPANDILTEEEHRYIFEKEMQVQAAKAMQEGGVKELHCGACGNTFVSMSGTSFFCPVCRQQQQFQSPFSSDLATSTSDYIIVTQQSPQYQQQHTQPQLLKPGQEFLLAWQLLSFKKENTVSVEFISGGCATTQKLSPKGQDERRVVECADDLSSEGAASVSQPSIAFTYTTDRTDLIELNLPQQTGDRAADLPSDSGEQSNAPEEAPIAKRRPSAEKTDDFVSAADQLTEERSAISEVEEAPGKSGGKEGQRPMLTHFVAIRVTNPKVLDYCERVQKSVTEEAHAIMKEACVKREKVHLSMAVMRLESNEREQDAINAIKIATKELLDEKKEIRIRPTELGSFPGVLHLKMDDDTATVLKRYYELLSTELRKRNIQMAKEKSSEFKPHVTIIKSAQGMRKARKFPELKKKNKEAKAALKIPSIDDIKQKLGDEAELGGDTEQKVDKIELCSMLKDKQADGFFAVDYTLPLDEDIEITEDMRKTVAPPPEPEETKAKKGNKANKGGKKEKKQKKDTSDNGQGGSCRLEVRVTSPDFMTLCADLQDLAVKEAPKEVMRQATLSKDKLRIILNDIKIPSEKVEDCVAALKSRADEFLKQQGQFKLAGEAVKCIAKGVTLQLAAPSSEVIKGLRSALDDALVQEGITIDDKGDFEPSILLVRTRGLSNKLARQTEEVFADTDEIKSEMASSFATSLELRLFTMIGSGTVLLSIPLLSTS